MANLCTPVGSSITKEEWEEALAIAERWHGESASSFGPNKSFGILSRAFRHLRICYDELVRMNPDAPRPEVATSEAREVLLSLACMPPEGSIADGIRLLAARVKQSDAVWNEALENAARAVQMELRKSWPHDKNAANAVMALQRSEPQHDESSTKEKP